MPTVDSRVGPADGWDGGSSRDDELVVLADVVGRLGLGKDKVLKVQAQLADVAVHLRKIIFLLFVGKFICILFFTLLTVSWQDPTVSKVEGNPWFWK